MNSIKFWFDINRCGSQPHNTVNKLFNDIALANAPHAWKKACFELAYYCKATKATNPSDMLDVELAEVMLWLCQNDYDLALFNRNGFKF